MKELVAQNLAGAVFNFEDDAIRHPKTGEVIGDQLKMEGIKARGNQWGQQLQASAAARDDLALASAAKPPTQKKGGAR